MDAFRTNIDEKLVQDELRLHEMRSNLDKSQKLTDNMVIILDSFTSRLKKLDETIQPVYTQTLRLTRLQENVDKTLTLLERVIAYHSVADEVENRVRAGPSGNLEEYLNILDRLKEALDFFKQNNPDSAELIHVAELFEFGLEALAREFLQLLKKFSKPVPIATLHDVASSEVEEDIPPIDLLPVAVISQLKAIAEFLVSAPGDCHTDLMNVYSQLRSSTLGRALHSIKEDGQQGTQDLFGANLPKKASFPFLPTRKAITRKGQLVPGISTSSSAERGVVGEATVDEKLEGSHSFIMSSSVFLRLIQSETRLMSQIIPPSHHAKVLNELIKHPIEFFMRDGEALYHQAKRSIARNEYIVILSCLRLIRHLDTLLPEYRAVLEGLKSKPFERFPRLLQLFERLVSSTLSEQYILFIKGDSEKQSNLPKDGTVHELTSSTLWFAEHLLEYSRILGEIILGKGSFSVKSTDVDRKIALGNFLVQVFSALNLNMENKAHSYESPFLAAIFLLNNYHFIHKTFNRNTHLLGLLEGVFADIDSHYIGVISQQERAYQRGFTKLITFLGQEVSLQSSISGEKLSKQRRLLLKDKFKGFNTEFEELQRVQEQWSIPDSQLRSRVRADNADMVVSLYTDFYRMYGSLNFTKNYVKYVKFTPDTLEQHLNTFFDGGAS